MTTQYQERRAQTVAGLRELADWLEQHPDAPLAPYGQYEISHYVFGDDDTSGYAAVADHAAALGLDHRPGEDSTEAVQTFAGGVRYAIRYLGRERCRRHAALVSYSGSVQPAGAA